MARPMGSMVYGSPPQDGKIEELEKRVADLEELVDRLTKSNKPSFQDFKFIKEDEYKKDREERDNRLQMARMRSMFSV